MSRPRALALLLGLCGACGLGGSVDVASEFQVGGPLANLGTSFNSTQINQPLVASAGDLDKLSKVTLTAAKLESTDGKDLAFIDGATMTIASSGQPTKELATLGAPGAVGRAEFAVDAALDLKPYLRGGGVLSMDLVFANKPVAARGLKLTLTIRGEL